MLEVCDCLALMRLSLAAMTAAVLLGVAAPAKAEIVSTKCTLTHHKKKYQQHCELQVEAVTGKCPGLGRRTE